MSPRARRRRSFRHIFRVVVSFSFIVATSPTTHAEAPEPAPAQRGSAVHQSEIIARANSSTVKIKAQRQNGSRRVTSNGAGVIISATGYILTAHHVINGFSQIRISTVHGDHLPAEVVMVEEDFDLALLKVETDKPLEVAVLATASQVKEGRPAVVIGNPLGMGQSIIKGILGTARPVSWDGHRAPLHAVEASIVKGNSGGGTFDLETGELLGINVAKSSLARNTGYMVPVDRLIAILNRKVAIVELADSQEIFNSLGVRLRPVSLLEGKFTRGMLVTQVKPGSKAASAGWEVGDVLVGMDKYKMVDQDAVLYVLRDTNRDATSVNFLVARGDVIDGGQLSFDSQTAMAASASTSRESRVVAATP